MKFIHLSDLHIGKRVNDVSMLEDQEYILRDIQGIIREEQPDAVIIAGDVYDKNSPSAEAVTVFDDFLTALKKLDTKVLVLSGNHDSAERIAFGADIMKEAGVFMSPVYSGKVEPITFADEYGEVRVYMLPFIKPIHVKQTLPEEERADIETYDDAVKRAVADMEVENSVRNVLVTHQFVTGAVISDSEERTVGGTDEVGIDAFDDFDYVALGHIHRPQRCGRDTVRYCGTPLKYSFSEAGDKKSVTVVELKDKGDISLRFIDLVPRHDWVELRGTYDEVMSRGFYEGTSWQEDYVKVTLTDEQDIPEAMGKLRTVYHNIMKMEYDNRRTRESRIIVGAAQVAEKSDLDLFSELFEMQNNQEMSEEQRQFMEHILMEVHR